MPGTGTIPPTRSRALNQYVLKVHSRCDLACDHCYIYEHPDQTWRHRPRAMTVETVRAVAFRIAEHAAAHRLRQVHVVLHGGEPLLLGISGLRSTLTELRGTIDPVCRLDLRVQSNGVLLSPDICDLFISHQVKVGISLDGDLEANDRHRRFANGASSHRQVLQALALLRQPAYRASYAGILCTVDIKNDPIRVYEALLAQEPPRIDFLLPHATWDHPPWRPPGLRTPYARWLSRIYDRWLDDGRPTPIRLFDSLRSASAGGASGTEAIGLDPVDLIVIEADGTWEQADSLKTAYDGAAATGLDVFSHRVDEAAAHPGVAARRSGLAGLCTTCQECAVVQQCGGGLFAHRYRSGTGFDNPSVYCADLKEFVGAIGPIPARGTGAVSGPSALTTGLSPAVLDQLGSGYGDESTMEYLAMTQLSITRALLAAFGQNLRRGDATAGGGDTRWIALDGWELLERLDVAAPVAVRTVLAHPYVRAWLVRCLTSREASPPDQAHLACLAAAASVHAGIAIDVTVPVHAAMVHLPTLGRLPVVTPVAGTAALSTFPGGFVLRAGDTVETVATGDPRARHGGWQPLQRLDDDGVTVAIEDVDPYRDCHEWSIAGRLAGRQSGWWERMVTGAWASIRDSGPAPAPGLRIALRAVTPLRPDGNGRPRSSTTRHAFGAVGAAPPRDAPALAVVLIRGVQQVKLDALLDLCDLVAPTQGRPVGVPGQATPRPLAAVLRAAYGDLGVAGLWRARASEGGDRSSTANDHFQRYRTSAAAAIDAALRARGLTPAGERFVTRMRETVRGWPAESG
jgi:uncharacterized protein